MEAYVTDLSDFSVMALDELTGQPAGPLRLDAMRLVHHAPSLFSFSMLPPWMTASYHLHAKECRTTVHSGLCSNLSCSFMAYQPSLFKT